MATEFLTAHKVQSIREPGTHRDGRGLRLIVNESGTKRWELWIKIRGRRRQLGLGVYPEVRLQDAREKAETVSAGIEGARQERQRRERELAEGKERLAGLREKLAGRTSAVENLRRQVEERERSYNARREEIDRSDERVKDLRRAADEARNELASRSDELEKLAAASHRMRAGRDEIRAELESMRKAAREARSEHSGAQSDLGDLRVKESDLNLRLETAESRAVTDFSVSLAERLAKYEEAAHRREARERYRAAVAAGLESGEDYASELGLEAPPEDVEKREPGEDRNEQEDTSGPGDQTEPGPEHESEPDYEAGVPEPTGWAASTCTPSRRPRSSASGRGSSTGSTRTWPRPGVRSRT